MISIFTKCARIIVARDLSRQNSIGLKPDLQSLIFPVGRASARQYSPLQWVLLFLLPASVYAAPPTEYEVEAAFVHNIAKFVEWPTSVSEKGALRLCVLGQEPFGDAAENLLKDKPVDGRVWAVVPVSVRANLKDCNVLFIGAVAEEGMPRLLESIKDSPVLTVGDTDGYAGQGVMVNFYKEQEKVRFEINNDAATRAGLRISSHLLKLARIVRANGEPK